MRSGQLFDRFRDLGIQVQQDFVSQRRRLSFDEYLELFAADPVRHTRDAVGYVRDMLDHYGQASVERPAGSAMRYRLFSLEFCDEPEQSQALVAQEEVQNEIHRVLENLAGEARANRLLLLHGPTGSAKSTAVACMLRGLEHYSTLDEGALYKFSWVFPKQQVLRGAIGFGGRHSVGGKGIGSYAHLSDQELDARVVSGQRDHPLFLLPERQRIELLEAAYRDGQLDESPSRWIRYGSLCHQNRQIFEGLLQSYEGSLDEVLRHVQVERYFVSRRYRVGAVSLGPQLSVDAAERQLTADRSLLALPASLQALTLVEAFGELVDAAGGIIEFADLLKRPLEAFKYLQTSVETGEVTLASQNVQLNCVMVASTNEEQLAAFRSHPEYDSFRGRVTLVRVPYLLNWRDEQQIYDRQTAAQMRRHVAPHATAVAAQFAVLTRLHRPDPTKYSAALSDVVASLTAVEKSRLYSEGVVPSRLAEEDGGLLRAAVKKLRSEFDGSGAYEGSTGASPREIKMVLLDAAQSRHYACLSPFAVLDGLDSLCQRSSEFDWLRLEAEPGAYHDHAAIRRAVRDGLLDQLEDEFRMASGLVEEVKYLELFERYILHVNYWVKGERMVHPVTRRAEPADEALMKEVEGLISTTEDAGKIRQGIISRIAAWAIDHPDRPVDTQRVFTLELARMRRTVFAEHRQVLGRMSADLVALLRDGAVGLDDSRKKRAQAAFDRLKSCGYDELCAADAAQALLRERFSDTVAG